MQKALRDEPGVPPRILRIINEVKEDASNKNVHLESGLFKSVPFFLVKDRSEVDGYLGFRHVTGIKQWEPEQKAAFISSMVDTRGLDFSEVAKRIGSKSDTVRRNYLALRLLQQAEDKVESEDGQQAIKRARDRFSVFFLSLREKGVRDFLGVADKPNIEQIKTYPSDEKLDATIEFLTWMFGTQRQDSLVGDSRNVTKFGRVLASDDGLKYLRTSIEPRLEIAYNLTSDAKEELVAAFTEARRSLRAVLADLDLNKDDPDVVKSAWPVLSAAADIAKRIGGDTLSRLQKEVSGAGSS